MTQEEAVKKINEILKESQMQFVVRQVVEAVPIPVEKVEATIEKDVK